MAGTTRAVGVARQSRGDERSASVEEQRQAIEAYCEREGWELVATHEEQDVSGGRPLAKRPGLLAAVEAVEASHADVVLVAYFDRLVRSLAVQAEVVERVERAGGRIATLDAGEVSTRTAASWLSAQFLGAMSEYQRRTTAERVRSAHARLISEGRWVGGRSVALGYRLRDGRLEPDPDVAPAVRAAFSMRADGQPLDRIARTLSEAAGRDVSITMVQRLLGNRVVLGELRHGDLANPAAHEPIVDAALFRRVQEERVPRGPRPSSDLLLARLGVLRCGGCGARMVSATGGRPDARVRTYRCPPESRCDERPSVSAHIADAVVVDAVRRALVDAEGRAGADLRPLEARAERARTALSAAVEAFDGMGDLEQVRAKLASLRAELEGAEDELSAARGAASFALRMTDAPAGEPTTWNELSRQAQRELIRGVVGRATVHPGRGAERVRVELAEAFDPSRVLDREAAQLQESVEEERAGTEPPPL